MHAVAVDLREDGPQRAGKGHVGFVVEEGEFQPLDDDDGVRPQPAAQRFLELSRIEGLRRAVMQHVHRIDDHHVIAASSFWMNFRHRRKPIARGGSRRPRGAS